jgi:UDP-N-acetylglucosamine diphosphorylase/glucosamine-1-phosphate N-acetyltransferase
VTALYLLEPEPAGVTWAPFAGVRPVSELRAGAWRIRERWEAALDADAAAILGSHVDGFHDGDEPPVRPLGPIEGPAVVGLSRFAPSGTRVAPGDQHRRLVHEGSTVGWIVPSGDRWEGASDKGPALEIEGLLLHGAYDLVTALERLLPGDCADFRAAPAGPVPEGSLVLGDPADVRCRDALVEPGVLFDVRQGAVVLEPGSEVRHGARLEGPVYVGAGTRILGGAIRGSSFGPQCRAHGEISATVFLGYGNKSHEGFLGHSVVGQWVNLGAGTTTSNLKNTYGSVRLEVGGSRIETGRINLGTLFGDHVKTAIGTLLATGTVVAAGANVFGGRATPKYVPPFAWGGGGEERMTEEGFLLVAERVLARRNVAFSAERRESLRRMFARGIGR